VNQVVGRNECNVLAPPLVNQISLRRNLLRFGEMDREREAKHRTSRQDALNVGVEPDGDLLAAARQEKEGLENFALLGGLLRHGGVDRLLQTVK
jgi:hypothetical protein